MVWYSRVVLWWYSVWAVWSPMAAASRSRSLARSHRTTKASGVLFWLTDSVGSARGKRTFFCRRSSVICLHRLNQETSSGKDNNIWPFNGRQVMSSVNSARTKQVLSKLRTSNVSPCPLPSNMNVTLFLGLSLTQRATDQLSAATMGPKDKR